MKKIFSVKNGNISIALLVSLAVLFSGAAIVQLAVNSKYKAREAYERIENRYLAESGIEMAVGLFVNYLSNQEYALAYTKNADDSYSIVDEYSPYLLDEIRQAENEDSVSIDLVVRESNDYLSSIGFLDFARNGGVELAVSIFHDKERFKLSRMCIEPGFAVSGGFETDQVQSGINPIYLTVRSNYKGGEVLCNIEIFGLHIVRKPFHETGTGEMASVQATVDTSNVKTIYQNYQNYMIKGGGAE